jgi:Family of unknown function (DUF6335)
LKGEALMRFKKFLGGEVLKVANTGRRKSSSEKRNSLDENNIESSAHEDQSVDADLDELGTDIDVDESAKKIVPSYGTGVEELPGYTTDGRQMFGRIHNYNEGSETLTGGDVDANYEQADADGDESVGGTAPTPDMDIVDNLGKAVGIEMDDTEFLHTNDILEQRDDERWEMEPRSSEDYDARIDDEDRNG